MKSSLVNVSVELFFFLLLLQVFKPIVEKFGIHFDCDIRMRSVPVYGQQNCVQLCVCDGVFVCQGVLP